MNLYNLLLGFGIPVAFVLGICVVVQYPRFVGACLRAFSYLGPWVKRKSLATELQGSVNAFVGHFNSNYDSSVLPECRIEWVNDKNVQNFLGSGKALIKLSFSKDDRDLNYYNAAYSFIQTGFLPQTKPFLYKITSAALDLLVTKTFLLGYWRPALRIFNSRFGEQDDKIKALFTKLEETDEGGLFSNLFVQELHYFGEVVGSKSPSQNHSDETERFLVW